MNYDAVYTYYVKDFNNDRLNPLTARCVIIGETDKSYRIRLMENTFNRWHGETLWVRKKAVSRSYYDNDTKKCDIYELSPIEQSCRACIQRCQRRWDLLRKR